MIHTLFPYSQKELRDEIVRLCSVEIRPRSLSAVDVVEVCGNFNVMHEDVCFVGTEGLFICSILFFLFLSCILFTHKKFKNKQKPWHMKSQRLYTQYCVSPVLPRVFPLFPSVLNSILPPQKYAVYYPKETVWQIVLSDGPARFNWFKTRNSFILRFSRNSTGQ